MKIFATDLDSTIIVNKPPKNLDGYICISETPRGKSYISQNNLNKLIKINNLAKIIPITTRGLVSYNTINLGFSFEFALVDNGAILLHNNKIDKEWLKESQEIFKNGKPFFDIAYNYLESNGFKTKTNSEFTIDFNIKDMTLEERDYHYEKLVELIGDKFDVFKAGYNENGLKGIYATYKDFNKGDSLKRLIKKLGKIDKVIVAGDSGSDWSMMKQTLNSIGLSDSPSQYQFEKEKFKNYTYDYIDFVIDTVLNLVS